MIRRIKTIIYLNCINDIILVMEMHYVFFEVKTFLNNI